jgi:hypothetical protein
MSTGIRRLRGSIWSYNPARLVGTIIHDETNLRFFFHASSVRFGPREITISARCSFVIDPKLPPAGKLPIAREIELFEEIKLKPVEPVVGVDALASPLDSETGGVE